MTAIKINNGSVLGIDKIPAVLRHRFKETFEIEPKWILQAAARLGVKDLVWFPSASFACHAPVIDLMEGQKKLQAKGGTMRLGAYPCSLKSGSLAERIYGTSAISERHRHRWEFNNQYLAAFEQAGMMASGLNPDSGLVEVIELKGHPFFIGVQYHPELKSTVENPHPIFVHFIKAALEQQRLVSNTHPQGVEAES